MKGWIEIPHKMPRVLALDRSAENKERAQQCGVTMNFEDKTMGSLWLCRANIICSKCKW